MKPCSKCPGTSTKTAHPPPTVARNPPQAKAVMSPINTHRDSPVSQSSDNDDIQLTKCEEVSFQLKENVPGLYYM